MGITFFGLTFRPYGFILGLAILAAFQASVWLAKERKIDKKMIEKLFWWVVIGGIVGARLYHVIDKWSEIYSLDPMSSFYLWNGGLGIWGAIGGGVAGLWLGKRFLDGVYPEYFRGARNDRTRGLRLVDLLDVVLFGVPLGQAIGRWGNYFNNEIVGKKGEPLFLYESVLDLLLFGMLVGLVKLDKFEKRPGTVAGGYLIGYGLIRLSLEQLRPENIIWKVAGVPTASLVSMIAVLAGVTLIYWRRQS